MTPDASQPGEIERQILAALRRITRAIDLRSRTLLQIYGLTAPQLAALEAIGRLQPITATRLAREIHVGQPTLTGILERLMRHGWIEKTRGKADRRQVQICLTEKGSTVLREAPSALQDRFRQRLSSLADWEQTMILGTLQRVATMMEVDATPPKAVADLDVAEPGVSSEVSATWSITSDSGPQASLSPRIDSPVVPPAASVEPSFPAVSLPDVEEASRSVTHGPGESDVGGADAHSAPPEAQDTTGSHEAGSDTAARRSNASDRDT